MRIRLAGTMLVTLLLVQSAALCLADGGTSQPSRVLYVASDGRDSNSGRSPDQAFATITQATTHAQPGDTISVAPGTYHGAITTNTSGTPDHPITIQSQTPQAAHIDATGHYTAWTNNGNYITIQGFDISGSDYQGILNYGSHVTITHNDVHNLKTPSCNTPNGGAGINNANYQAHGNIVTDNIVHDILAPPGPCPLIHGIYQANHEGTIQNNIIYNITYAGIHLWHAANHITISNNLIWNATVGILVGGEDVKADDNIVTNNILIHNQIGIRELGDNFGTNNQYLNNLLYDNQTNFMMITGKPRGSVFANPQFFNFKPDGTGNYHLKPTSPAIDAGTTTGAPATDIDGTPRPQGRTIDIGPYEYVPRSSTSGR